MPAAAAPPTDMTLPAPVLRPELGPLIPTRSQNQRDCRMPISARASLSDQKLVCSESWPSGGSVGRSGPEIMIMMPGSHGSGTRNGDGRYGERRKDRRVGLIVFEAQATG